jgi:type VI secretion system secreted protein VgrG
MATPKYKEIGSSISTSIDNPKRKDVLIKLPQYSQTFDISALIDYSHMRPALQSQPYRIYLADDTIKQHGAISDATGTVRTDSSIKVRCEIGAGKWEILEDGFNHSDISKDTNEESI